MIVKVAVPEKFKLKVVPDFRTLIFGGQKEIHYIGGTDILPPPLENEKEEEVIGRLGTEDDQEAKKLLIEHNLRLVVYIAKKFDNTGVGVEDLISIGTIGLIKAIDRFDTSLSYSFSTYAVPLIMGEIRRFLRDDGMIHTSRQMKEHARKIAIVREQIKKTQNKEPTLQELAEKTGIAIEDLVVAMEAGREVDSFSRPVTENDGKVLTLEEKLEDNHRFETPLLNHIALKQAIDQLPEEEAQLIKFRYMDNLSQAETAKRMGKNQVSVSRSERKILEKLRRKML